MRISDWSSDVCSSDLILSRSSDWPSSCCIPVEEALSDRSGVWRRVCDGWPFRILRARRRRVRRSEEHTSELQSLMRISYAVFCLKKKKTKQTIEQIQINKQS